MQKIVINNCYGGFGLSEKAVIEYLKLKGKKVFIKKEYGINHYYTNESMTDDSYFSDIDIQRNDSDLIAIIEKLGTEASGKYAELKIVEIPKGIDWKIEEYDGTEWVSEVHRTWN